MNEKTRDLRNAANALSAAADALLEMSNELDNTYKHIDDLEARLSKQETFKMKLLQLLQEENG